MKIECPRCWVECDRKEIDVFGPNIFIDICPKCKGLWLDKGELGKLLKDRKITDFLTKHIGTQSKSELICPRCGSLMDFERAEDVEVDVCLRCHGVWLDANELERLREKSEEGYEGDELAKAVERWEELDAKQRDASMRGFFRRLARAR